MVSRCEYCRQQSDGLECRKCGAPLPFMEPPKFMIPDDIDDIEVDWSEPGGVVRMDANHDYVRRNQINNAISMVDGLSMPVEKVLEYLGEPCPEEAMQSFAAYNHWYQRSLVNWRLRE